MMPGLLKTSSPGTSAPTGSLILWLGLSLALANLLPGTAAANPVPRSDHAAVSALGSADSSKSTDLTTNSTAHLNETAGSSAASQEADPATSSAASVSAEAAEPVAEDPIADEDVAPPNPDEAIAAAASEQVAADPVAVTLETESVESVAPSLPSQAAEVAQVSPTFAVPSYSPSAPFAFQPPAAIANPVPYPVPYTPGVVPQPIVNSAPYNPAAPFAFQPPVPIAYPGYAVTPVPTVPGFSPAGGQVPYSAPSANIPLQVPFPPGGNQQTTLPAPPTASAIPSSAYPAGYPLPTAAYPAYPYPYPYAYGMQAPQAGYPYTLGNQPQPVPYPYPYAPIPYPTGSPAFSYPPAAIAPVAPAPSYPIGSPTASPYPYAPGTAAPATAQTVPTPAPTPPPLLPSSALTPPSVQVQGVYLRQGDEDSARARLTAVYPVTPRLLFGGSLDLTTGDAFSDSRSEGLSVNELYLATALEDLPNLRFVIGQLDLTSYFDRNSFAKDGASQFFNSVFQTNPALTAASIGSRPALLVNWSLNDNIEARAAAFSSARNIGDFALDGFAGEIGFRFGNAIIRGTYVSGRDAGADDGFNEIFGINRGNGVTGLDDDDREEGYGVNAEVFIPELNMGIFGRYGHYENRALEEGGDTFSGGISFLDVFSRDDRLGLAYGRALSNDRLREAAGNRTPDVLELFYDFRLLPNLRLGITLQQQNEFSETIAGFRIRTDFDVTPRGL